MFVINGITGKVGGRVGDILIEAGLPVRALVRSAGKGASWKARGCEIALVPDAADAQSLAQAFAGATGVFLMNPPNYDSERDFPDIQRSAKASAEAIAKAKPDKIVLLSTIGAHVQEFNLLNRSTLFEHMLANAGVPVAFLRAAWFMENAAWDLAAARPQDRHGQRQGYRPRGGRPAARGMVRREDCRTFRSAKVQPAR